MPRISSINENNAFVKLQESANGRVSVKLQKNQFAYNKNAPVWDDLRVIVEDVLWKWTLERNGHTDVGRVLPNNYFWFNGDGKHNYFRDTYETYKAHIWDYSLESPYES